MNGATLKSTSVNANNGASVTGRGGDDASGSQYGVLLVNGAKIIGGTSGNIGVGGTGGASVGPMNCGVLLSGTGCAITSSGANIYVSGQGGSLGSASNTGLSVLGGAEVSTTGSGTLSAGGTGGGVAGSASNHGFELSGLGSRISSAYGITLGGSAGSGASAGVYLADSGVVTKTADFGLITISCNDLEIDSTASINATGDSTQVQITSPSNQVVIDLGGVSTAGNPPTLGLTNATLNRINAAFLNVGLNGNASLVVSAPLTLSSIRKALTLTPGSPGITATAAGVDLTLVPNAFCFLDGPLRCAVSGPLVDTDYPRLKVVGGCNLNGKPLLLSSTYAGVAGDTFTIIDNDGSDAIVGTFAGLPEGTYLAWPGSSTLAARISYVGGTGNDVTLTLIDVAAATTVTNTANSGTGSLRETIASAAIFPGPNTITLAPALSGATIPLAGDISIQSDVTIDATNLPAGLTLSGGGTNRIFFVSNATVSLKGLTFTNGTGTGANQNTFGGAINNGAGGILSLAGCTFFNNSAHHDGGAIYVNGGTVTLTRCTFTGNSGFDGGGPSAIKPARSR